MSHPLLKNLCRDSNGIWHGGQSAPLAYPDDGSEKCFHVEDRSFWFKHRNDCILAAVRRFPPSGTMVDVGGGNGFVTRRLLDEGVDTMLLEPGIQGCLHAKIQRNIPSVACSTLGNLDIPSCSLDAIGMFDVLEHIKHEEEILDDVFRVLKPGGKLYLTVPACQWLWSQSDDFAQHFRRYSRIQLLSLMGCRFIPLYGTYFFAALTLPVLLLRSLPYRIMPKRGAMLSSDAEHGTDQGRLVAFLERSLRKEVDRIVQGKMMAVGTSFLLVVKKPEEL